MSNVHPDHDEVITLPVAARLLGVGPTTLKRWSDQGRIPHTRTPGGHRRFLRSVILDLRALVDPRAGHSQANGPLSLRLGAPSEWLDRAHTLADPDRMEAALLALRASCSSWGETSEAVLRDFVLHLKDRFHSGQLSEGSWRAVRSSLVRSVLRAAGRLRPRLGAPVALLASPGGGESCELLTALAETVLRERGFTVLEIGCMSSPAALAEVINEQRPHQVVLLAEKDTDPTLLAARIEGVGRLVPGRGSELWLVGSAEWPPIEGARRIETLTQLDRAAATSSDGSGSGAHAM